MDGNNLLERVEKVIKLSIHRNRPHYILRQAAEKFIKENYRLPHARGGVSLHSLVVWIMG
jgi:hypothetical protein